MSQQVNALEEAVNWLVQCQAHGSAACVNASEGGNTVIMHTPNDKGAAGTAGVTDMEGQQQEQQEQRFLGQEEQQQERLQANTRGGRKSPNSSGRKANNGSIIEATQLAGLLTHTPLTAAAAAAANGESASPVSLRPLSSVTATPPEQLPSLEPWRATTPGGVADLHNAAINARLAFSRQQQRRGSSGSTNAEERAGSSSRGEWRQGGPVIAAAAEGSAFGDMSDCVHARAVGAAAGVGAGVATAGEGSSSADTSPGVEHSMSVLGAGGGAQTAAGGGGGGSAGGQAGGKGERPVSNGNENCQGVFADYLHASSCEGERKYGSPLRQQVAAALAALDGFGVSPSVGVELTEPRCGVQGQAVAGGVLQLPTAPLLDHYAGAAADAVAAAEFAVGKCGAARAVAGGAGRRVQKREVEGVVVVERRGYVADGAAAASAAPAGVTQTTGTADGGRRIGNSTGGEMAHSAARALPTAAGGGGGGEGEAEEGGWQLAAGSKQTGGMSAAVGGCGELLQQQLRAGLTWSGGKGGGNDSCSLQGGKLSAQRGPSRSSSLSPGALSSRVSAKNSPKVQIRQLARQQ